MRNDRRHSKPGAARVCAGLLAALLIGVMPVDLRGQIAEEGQRVDAAPVVAVQTVATDPRSITNALQRDLTRLSKRLEDDPDARSLPIAELRLAVGLEMLQPDETSAEARFAAFGQTRALSAPVGHAPATVELVNFRLALAMLSQTYRGRDNLDVLLAQPEGRTDAISFRGGLVTLADIRRETARIAEGDTIRIPILLWDDTILRLGPEDSLTLSRPDGAFLVSFGRVEIAGSTLKAQGEANPASPDFVPFVTIAGGGSLKMSGAHVSGLGFGQTAKFSGLAVAANPLMRNTGTTLIESSRFDDIATLSIVGKPGAVVRGNSFANMRDAGLMLQSAGFAVVSDNLFFGPAPTNAIRLLDGAQGARVTGNMILGGDRAGILVDNGSHDVRLANNVVWARDGGGIKLSRVRCGVVRDNIVIGNRQKGIELRRSDRSTVIGNLIGSSRNSGIWISAQASGSLSVVAHNTLHGNRAGLTMASGGSVQMVGNDFSTQMPRILDGDIALHGRAIIKDLRGATPLSLNASGSTALETAPEPLCDAGKGF